MTSNKVIVELLMKVITNMIISENIFGIRTAEKVVLHTLEGVVIAISTLHCILYRKNYLYNL